MENLSELHREIIQFHNDYPVNFVKKENDENTIEAYNPFCGDRYYLSVDSKDGRFNNVSFHGHGCALSKASTSILMKLLTGSDQDEFMRIFQNFQDMLLSSSDSEMPEHLPEELHVFEGVRRSPSRHTCAVLSWTALHNQLKK